jgi:hypothetical protein
MANANKNKGKSYERVVAKHLSNITGLSFLRVPNSGAFVGGMNFHRSDVLSKEQVGMFEGDIITPVEWNHIRLECKFYKEITWSSLFSKDGEPKINSWIKQNEQGTRPYWFICFKLNRIGEFVITPTSYWLINNGFLTQEEDAGFFIYRNKYRIVSMDNFFEMNNKAIFNLNPNNIKEQSNGTDIGNKQTK